MARARASQRKSSRRKARVKTKLYLHARGSMKRFDDTPYRNRFAIEKNVELLFLASEQVVLRGALQ
jgi:hypothetical protein